ncbi:MAG: Crp/Fnr family transcriptional regulator [Clostridia bacterium]
MPTLHFLAEVPFFRDLSPEELTQIRKLFIERRYKKGAPIFFEGDPGEEFFIVKYGTVKIFRFDRSREVILALFREGDYFGEMAVLQKHEVRSASAQTLDACVLYAMKRKDFEHLLESNPRLTLKLVESLMDRLRKANEQIEDLTFLDARSRIIKNLLNLAEEHGVTQDDGRLIDLKLTHQQIADMVGTVRETVTKVLLELQDKALISVDKKKILLKDLPALESLIQSHTLNSSR